MKLQLQINGVIKAESAFHFTKFGFIKSLHDIRQKEIAEALQRFKKEYAAKYLSQDENGFGLGEVAVHECSIELQMFKIYTKCQ